jgi:hypothetical protein
MVIASEMFSLFIFNLPLYAIYSILTYVFPQLVLSSISITIIAIFTGYLVYLGLQSYVERTLILSSDNRHLRETTLRKRTKILWKIGLPGIRFWINTRYDLRVNGSFPEPPFLLLANHTQNIDPFFLLSKIRNPVSFVINNAVFQNPIVGLFLRWIDSIPKQKSTSDMKTVIDIFRLLKE